MAAVLIEFILSFLYITVQLNNISLNNNLSVNLINKQIESNYNNVYQSYLYNIYQDAYDNNYFENFLSIKNKNCDNDNTGDWDSDEELDWCLLYFVKDEGDLYKYKGKVSSLSDINKNWYQNAFIPWTFVSVKKTDDYYDFHTFYIYAWRRILLWDFLIYKNK